jgi:protein-S-isoprenylcysteine O-methyltransferase Ste14
MTIASPFSLVLRSLFWTLILPGFIAVYVPWMFCGLGSARITPITPITIIALITIGCGAVLLAACIFEFARSGHGTLSPADPPRQLVVRGLYNYVRNPMYLGVSSMLLGEALLLRSQALLAYWIGWFVLVNVFVIAYEEPVLRRQFGSSYEDYSRAVGRWIPRFHHTRRP